MLPAVKNDTARAQHTICIIQTIKPICHAIATLISLGNKGTPHRREVRAILIREPSIGRAYMRLWRAAAVAHRTAKQRTLLIEAPHHEARHSGVTRKVHKEGYMRIIPLLAAETQKLRRTLRNPTSQTHCATSRQVVAHPQHPSGGYVSADCG